MVKIQDLHRVGVVRADEVPDPQRSVADEDHRRGQPRERVEQLSKALLELLVTAQVGHVQRVVHLAAVLADSPVVSITEDAPDLDLLPAVLAGEDHRSVGHRVDGPARGLTQVGLGHGHLALPADLVGDAEDAAVADGRAQHLGQHLLGRGVAGQLPEVHAQLLQVRTLARAVVEPVAVIVG